MPFTIEFNDDGTIAQVFEGGIATPRGSALPRHTVSSPGSPNMITKNLTRDDGTPYPVKNITSVAIVKANPTCIWQDGQLWCIP